nr:MAG TPA: hypothetical protein [Caudoviricetes sp.]
MDALSTVSLQLLFNYIIFFYFVKYFKYFPF